MKKLAQFWTSAKTFLTRANAVPLMALLIILLSSCNENRQIKIDMQSYKGLTENDQFYMIIHNPNDSSFVDTVEWSGKKQYTWPVTETWPDCLAFVDVFKKAVKENEYDTLLLCTVVAIEKGGATIKAESQENIMLSGSNSNKLINNFWHGEKDSEYNDADSFTKYLGKEISNHSEDLYGAYLYSVEQTLNIINSCKDADKRNSIALIAQELQKESEQSDTYAAKHHVSILNDIIKAGDFSPAMLYNFMRYMLH